MLVGQDFACAICRLEIWPETLHVDHDHKCCPGHPSEGEKACGRCVRGFLCRGCNVGLGSFSDDPARLVSAARYVQRSTALWRG